MFQLDDRRFNRLAVLGLSFGFVLLLAAFVATISVFSNMSRAIAAVTHTHEVVNQLSQLEVRLERAEAARRGILLWPDAYRRSVFQDTVERLPDLLDRVQDLTSDNPTQGKRGEELRSRVEVHSDELKASVRTALAGDGETARQMFIANTTSQPNIRRVRDLIEQMRDEELLLLRKREADAASNLTAVKAALAATGVLLLLIGAATFWLVRRYTVDLTRTRDRLNVLNANLESAVQSRTADLIRANEEIQRFAYIVSHDLRSPLVNVLGFTAELESANKAIGSLVDRVEQEKPELMSEEARFAAREDLPEAIQFIRSSTQKMDRLINAILALSRQGRRVLTPEQLPMNAIIQDVIASLATVADEQSSEVVIEGKLPDIVHDRLAIEQIFQNLIENAIKYQERDKPGNVEVGGVAKGSRAIFEVRDNGRGIAPEDHRRIFELFRRSGTQDQRGEGIGLAHVQSLVFRLGGTIDVKSTLGEGSTFIVNLPIEYRERGDH